MLSHMYSSWFDEWDPFSNFTMMTPFIASWFFMALINLWRFGSRESTLIPRVLRTLVSLTHVWAPVSAKHWTEPGRTFFQRSLRLRPTPECDSVSGLTLRYIRLGFLGEHGTDFPSDHSIWGMGGMVSESGWIIDIMEDVSSLVTNRSFTHSIWGNVVSAWPDCTWSVSMLNKVDISSDMEATPDSGGTSSIWVTLEELLQTACMWPVSYTFDTLLANEGSFPCVGAGCPVHGIGCHSQGTQILMRGMSWFEGGGCHVDPLAFHFVGEGSYVFWPVGMWICVPI